MFGNARHRLGMRNARIQMRRMEDRNSGRQGLNGGGGPCVYLLLAGSGTLLLAAVVVGSRVLG